LVLIIIYLTCYNISAEIVNRIIAVVNDDVVTSYDLEKAAMWNGKEVANLTEEERNALVKQLINRLLVYQEVLKSGDLNLDAIKVDNEAREMLDKNPDLNFSFEETVDYLKSQMIIQIFARQRFGPLVQITDDDVKRYYNDVYLKAVAQDENRLPMSEVYNRIYNIIEVKEINALLEDWLNKQYESNTIVFMD
ncbi:MAG: hypothetical protein JW737_06020, partial [Acidobacteria bacterium]|nr:hypothetical protein [Acidobacteriota bacterium]